MKIVALTDLHGNVERLDGLAPAIAGADLVILSGDITHFGGEREALAVVNAVRGINANICAVPGNCDYPGVLAFLEREGLSVHERVREFGGFQIAGVGGSLRCPGRTPNERTEEEFGDALAKLAKNLKKGAPLVFVSHQPPRDTLCDLARGGLHVGSVAIRRFIEEVQPLVCFSGHIHEASGIDFIGVSKLANPGPMADGGYAWAGLTGRVEELRLMKGTEVVASL
jgi:Icc-related predicted phosphoesterase